MIEIKLNLFSEFILNKFNGLDTEIQLCDCGNFTLVKGQTKSDVIVSIKDCAEEFSEKFKEYQIKNTIDLIEYKNSIENRTEFCFSYKKNDKLKNTFYYNFSSFPYGFSMNQGKLLFFYFHLIYEKLPSNYLYEELYFDVNIDENNKVLFKVIKDNQEDENMKSLIEDCFSFNLKEIEEYIKEMDLEKLILNPNHKLFSDFNIEDFILL
jgi:hypothetical protein